MDPHAIDIFKTVSFDDSITKYELHTYQPRTQNYANNDEIRIAIQQQDILTLPSESFIRIVGNVDIKNGAAAAAADANNVNIVRNGFSFLFDEIRYELNGIEIDRVRDVGILSTIKGYLTIPNNDLTHSTAGWNKTEESINYDKNTGEFFVHIPLKFWLGFAEDYRKIMTNVKQELILMRARTDADGVVATPATTNVTGVEFHIDKITWHVPHVQVNDEIHLSMLEYMRVDRPIMLPFHKWELHELPSLRTSDRDVWTVKTSTNLEKPRYVIVAFQVDKRDKLNKDASLFDHCNIRNIKIFLNSTSYPYDNLNLDIPKDYYLAYQMYTEFSSSYGGGGVGSGRIEPHLSYNDFLKSMIYVFDVSKQNDITKTSTVDLKIEMEAKTQFNQNTRAYCLIISDSIAEYTTISGLVRKIVN